MKKTKTTDDVLRDFEKRIRKERKELDEGYEASKQFLRDICDSGLVDDVIPTGPPPVDDLELICGTCLEVIPPPDIICSKCNPYGSFEDE